MGGGTKPVPVVMVLVLSNVVLVTARDATFAMVVEEIVYIVMERVQKHVFLVVVLAKNIYNL
jgi:hypothetical protein